MDDTSMRIAVKCKKCSFTMFYKTSFCSLIADSSFSNAIYSGKQADAYEAKARNAASRLFLVAGANPFSTVR